MSDETGSPKKIWTPQDSEVELTPEQREALEKEFIKQRQEEHVISVLPSEWEKITKVLGYINQKFVGKPITQDTKQKIEQEVKSGMEKLGFKVKVSFNPLLQYQSPEVTILGRVEFDMDEAAKLLFELKERGGYKGDFNEFK